jgi:hypothetical protein
MLVRRIRYFCRRHGKVGVRESRSNPKEVEIQGGRLWFVPNNDLIVGLFGAVLFFLNSAFENTNEDC